MNGLQKWSSLIIIDKSKRLNQIAITLLCFLMVAGGVFVAPSSTAYAEAQGDNRPTLTSNPTTEDNTLTEEDILTTLSENDVDNAITCNLTPKRDTYAAGESMQFILTTQFSDPGDDSKPQTVKLGIDLPKTTPAARLPMFNRVGTGEYEGVPMYSLSYGGNTVNLYLVTLDDGSHRIEYTLNAGDTIQGIISMYLPNGISEPVSAYTLTPKVLSDGEYGKTALTPGTVAVTADFGWNDVKMESSTNNIGVISGENHDPDRVIMTITADSKANGLASGAIFTEHYVLSTETVLNSMHINDGTLTSSESAGLTSYFIDGKKVLDVAKPMDDLKVEKVITNGAISGFKITYTNVNTTLDDKKDAPEPIPNVNIPITLYTSELKLNDTHTETSIVTTTTLDTYSVFYDEETGKTDEKYHDTSTDSNTVYTTDNYKIEKEVYTDEACTQPFDVKDDYMEDGNTYYYKIVATNNSGTTDDFIVEDVLPDGLQYVKTVQPSNPTVSAQTLKWNNISIPAGGSTTIIVETKFDIDKISSDSLKNVATLSQATKGILSSATVQTTFRAGETADSEIKYEKKASTDAGGVGDPLNYTIDVKNANKNASKYITVQDNWPGDKVVPKSAKVNEPGVCSEIVLLDETGKEYHFDDNLTGITIKKIQFKGLYIPAGGTVRLTINSTIIGEFDQLVNTVQTGTGDGEQTASKPSYGMSINKKAYAYTAEEGIGKELTIQDLEKKDDIVCYKIDVKNLKNSPITGATVTDKLPTYLPLTEGKKGEVTGQILMEQKETVTSVTSSPDSNNYYTTKPFDLDPDETVSFYLFTKVDDATIEAAKTNSNKVTNYAYASFNGIQTGDASANFYIYEDKVKTFYMLKETMWIGNYTDDLKYIDSGLRDWALGDGADQKNTSSIQKGNYVIYRIRGFNKTGAGYDVPIYEVLDQIPEGMEFIGVLKSGYMNVSTDKNYNKDLSDKIIRDGETAHWDNNEWPTNKPNKYYIYSADLSCSYDASSRTVHILINGGDINNPVNVGNSYEHDSQQVYFYVVTKATESKSSYTNTAEFKTTKDVTVTGNNGTTKREDENFGYFKNKVTTYSAKMTPGITKRLLGHYYPSDPTRVETNSTINPDESLRYQIQVKNQDNSTNYSAATGSTATAPTYSYIKNYTVTDILPAEYSYKPGSTTFAINRTYNKETGEQVELTGTELLHKEPEPYSGTDLEPTVEQLADGRTKLTWTFNEYKYRLLNAYMKSARKQYQALGFMNLLTYDVNRNKDYGSTYGSYTNTATAQFDYDFTNVSTGSPDYSTDSISATNIVNVFGASGTSASKNITNAKGESASGIDKTNKVKIEAGEIVRYTLQVKNATEESTVGKLVFIDELPREKNDTGVVNRVDRNSEFSFSLTDTPKLQVQLVEADNTRKDISASDYTVYYGTSTGEGLKAKGDWSVGSGGFIDWTEDSSGKNAIRIIFNDSYTITAGQAIEISYDAKAADTLTDGKEIVPGSVAWNSFGYAYQAIDQDGTKSPTIYSEPQKVGAYLEGSQIVVGKKVAGNNYPTDKPFTFQLTVGGIPQANVAYRLNNNSTLLYTDGDGKFKLYAGQTATLYTKPITTGGAVAEILTDMPDGFSFVSVDGDGSVDPNNPNQFTFGDALDEGRKVVNFNNLYTPPKTTDIGFSVIKKLQGQPLSDDQRFKFTLKRIDGGAESDVEMPSANACVVQTDAMKEGTSPELAFGKITFKAAGTYQFEVSETDTNILGLTYAEPQVITVEVTKTDGQLNAKITSPETDGKLTFVNKNTPVSTEITNEVLNITKKLTGNNLPAGQSFSFELKRTDQGPNDAVTLPENCTITTETMTTGSSKPIGFDPITFHQAGTYTFEIKEKDSGISGMTYASLQQVTVTVTDDNGQLVARVTTPSSGGHLTFTNSYESGKITDANLTVTKKIEGDDLPEAKAFSFTLKRTDGGDEKAVVMPSSLTITTNAITKDTSNTIGFDDIIFRKAGTYSFDITETASDITHMAYADKQTVYVKVTQDTDTKALTPMIVDADGNPASGALTFTNTYDPTDATLTKANLNITKQLKGNELPSAKAFSFTIAQTDGDPNNVTMPSITTISTEAISKGHSQAVGFNDITFKKAGIYKFTITETANQLTGMTDASPQTIVVSVTDDHGVLKASVTKPKSGGALTFENTYETGKITDAALNITKTLSGPQLPISKVFTFTLALTSGDESAVTMPIKTTVTTNPIKEESSEAEGFGDIQFRKAGEYTFTVTEAASEIHGMTDAAEKKVYVKVTQDPTTFVLTPTIVDAEGKPASGELNFINTYKPDEARLTKAALTVTKTLKGNELETPKSFSFTLSRRDAGEKTDVTMPATQTITTEAITKDSATPIGFDDIIFHKAGTYTFRITETASDVVGMADAQPQDFTVVVSDNNGVLQTKITKPLLFNGNLTFVNRHPSIKVTKEQLSVTKAITGHDLPEAKAFSFTLSRTDEGDADAVQMPEKQTVITQAISTGKADPVGFGDITFYKPGIYEFKIEETNSNIANMTYAASQTVKIAVSAVGDLLKAEITSPAKGGALVFENKYEPTEASAKLSVTKTIQGNSLPTAKTFSFTLAQTEGDTNAVDMASPQTITTDAISSGTSQAKTFGDITFKKAGNYTFTVTETKSNIPGMTDAAPQTIKVEVTDDNGTLKAEITNPSTQGDLNFTNTYATGKVTSAALNITKTIEGQQLPEAKTFSFTLERTDQGDADAVTMPTGDGLTATTKEMTSGSSDPVGFDDIQFHKAGTYTFSITETASGITGMTDAKPQIVTIKVTQDENTKALTPTIVGENGGALTFTNTYKPADTNLGLTVTKELKGNPLSVAKAFTFMLKRTDKGDAKDVTMPTSEGLKATTPAMTSGSCDPVRFGDITFHKAGIYTFSISEEATDLIGMVDAKEQTVTIVVTDNNGQLEAKVETPTTGGALNFINTNTNTTISSTDLNITKAISGHPLKEGHSFSFTLTRTDKGDADAVILPKNLTISTNEISSGSSNTIGFDDIKFIKAGTYRFSVTEEASGITNMTDATTQTVYVKVEQNETTKALTASIVDADGNPASGDLTFTNTYTPTDATLTKAKLNITKRLKGNELPTATGFSFSIALDSDNTDNAVTMPAQTTINTEEISKGSATAVGFDDIIFHKAGTYTFSITETASGITGMTHASPQTVVVEVTDDGGKLKAEIKTPTTGGALNFTNTYATSSVTKAALNITKKIEGQTLPTAKAFSFTLARTDGGAAKDVTMPTGSGLTATTKQLTSGSSDPVGFGDIQFHKAGTYTFSITETACGIPGMTDAKPQTVTIKVTQDENTKALTPTIVDEKGDSANGALTFINTYKPEDGRVTKAELNITKKLEGSTLPEATSFTFHLNRTDTGSAEAVTMPENTTIATEAISSGSSTPVGFEDIIFHQAGTYTFSITEEATHITGMHDAEAQNITVKVVDKNGKLEASVVEPITTKGKLTFVNTYATSRITKTALNITKTIKGEPLPEGKPFTFTLSRVDHGDADAVTMPIDKKVTTGNITSGSATPVGFGDIIFHKAGTYQFEIAEQASGIAGMTDAVPQTVTIRVTEKDKQLEAHITQPSAGGALIFVNTYKPADGQAKLSVTKTIQGNTLPEAKAFKFTLSQTDNIDTKAVTMPAIKTITTNAITGGTSEAKAFGDIIFHKAGTYTFSITEEATGITGMTDASAQEVTIVVTDNDGQLEAKVETPTTGGELNFINTYATSSVTKAALNITKKIEGQALPEGKTFNFTLARTDGGAAKDVTMPTGEGLTATTKDMTSGSSDPVGFGDIIFHKAGTYTFSITETASGIPGMTDAKPQTVTIKVTQDENTKALTPTIVNAKGQATSGALTFVNTYHPDNTTIKLNVTKEIKGNPLTNAKQFSFSLARTDNGAKEAVTMPEETSVTTNPITIGQASPVSFGEITFNQAGTYTFSVTETPSGIIGMTDAAPQQVTVSVTDNGGKLQASITEPTTGNDLTFVNRFPSVQVTNASINITKQLEGKALSEAKAFSFTLARTDEGETDAVEMPAELTTTTQPITSGQADPVGFGNIIFFKPGIYTFSITEEASGIVGMTDAQPQNITVTVTEKDSQLEATITEPSEGGALTFINTYKPEDGRVTKADLSITKKLEGSTLPEATSFTFHLNRTDAGSAEAVTMPENTTIATEAISSGSATPVGFEDIIFHQAGIYSFSITEQASGIDGMVDATPQYIGVTVVDKDGKLIAMITSPEDGGALTFVNTFNPTPTPTPKPTPEPTSSVNPSPEPSVAPTVSTKPVNPIVSVTHAAATGIQGAGNGNIIAIVIAFITIIGASIYAIYRRRQ